MIEPYDEVMADGGFKTSCGITQANHEPKSTSSHEPTSSQPRVKFFFLFCPEKQKIVRNKISKYQEKM